MIDALRPSPVAGFELRGGEDDGLALTHPAVRRKPAVNETAALVWGLCDGRRTVADLISLLAEAYPESAASIRQDVYDTLFALSDLGAIEWE